MVSQATGLVLRKEALLKLQIDPRRAVLESSCGNVTASTWVDKFKVRGGGGGGPETINR